MVITALNSFLKKEQCPDTLDYKSVPELKASVV